MFYPPSLLDLMTSERPQPRPVYDIPPVIVRHRPVRAFVARLVTRRGAAKPRTSPACSEPRPETV